jgi:hypothetical protein
MRSRMGLPILRNGSARAVPHDGLRDRRRILSLVATSRRIAEGELAVRTSVNRGDEIGVAGRLGRATGSRRKAHRK